MLHVLKVDLLEHVVVKSLNSFSVYFPFNMTRWTDSCVKTNSFLWWQAIRVQRLNFVNLQNVDEIRMLINNSFLYIEPGMKLLTETPSQENILENITILWVCYEDTQIEVSPEAWWTCPQIGF